MTLDDYTNFICSKIGQSDDPSRQACASYVQARYRMIWDSLLWRDARCLVNVTATGATLALPAAVERVVSIRLMTVNGSPCLGYPGFLEPVDDASLLESVPGVLGRTGTPQFYEEFADVDDPAQVRKLRLYPTPTSEMPAALLIAGKRPFPGSDRRRQFSRLAKRGQRAARLCHGRHARTPAPVRQGAVEVQRSRRSSLRHGRTRNRAGRPDRAAHPGVSRS